MAGLVISLPRLPPNLLTPIAYSGTSAFSLRSAGIEISDDVWFGELWQRLWVILRKFTNSFLFGSAKMESMLVTVQAWGVVASHLEMLTICAKMHLSVFHRIQPLP